jgi:hypothetical protein
MAYFLSPVGNSQQLDASGRPLSGGKILSFLVDSSTPAATFTGQSGATQQANPIMLNVLGLPDSPVWLAGGVPVKLVIQDASGVTLRTVDNISGINDTTTSPTEWVDSGLLATYLSATSFSVAGDQTGVLQVARRLRTQNTAGRAYSTILTSVYAAGITTVTLANDSLPLDAGLSSVAYGLLAPQNKSVAIVGVVSQLAGVPTGAVIERGSNANGTYIKWADGTLICTHSKTYPAGPVTALGSLFITTADDVWTYPIPFVAVIPAISSQVVAGLSFCWVGLGSGTTATEFSYRVLSPVSSAAQPVVSLVAVGRWF